MPLLLVLPTLSSIIDTTDNASKTLSPRSSPDEDMINAVINALRRKTVELQPNSCAACLEAAVEMILEAQTNGNYRGARRSGRSIKNEVEQEALKKVYRPNLVSLEKKKKKRKRILRRHTYIRFIVM